MSLITETQGCIDALTSRLKNVEKNSLEASKLSESIIKRAQTLDKLTSPASDASALLTHAQNNLRKTLKCMKEARDAFDTVAESEPVIRVIFNGARDAMDYYRREIDKRKACAENEGKDYLVDGYEEEDEDLITSTMNYYKEHDVYTATDAMVALRNSYYYFSQRKMWKSAPSALGGIERVHNSGQAAMCRLIAAHLTVCGPAVKVKETKFGYYSRETALMSRKRFTTALQNRNVVESVGEYEEFLCLDSRAVRELRSLMECLGSEKSRLGESQSDQKDASSIDDIFVDSKKVIRTEKCGCGAYTNMTRNDLKTGFPHLDAYGEARKKIALSTMDSYYRRMKNVLKREGRVTYITQSESGDLDAAARDAIRCLEQAMVIVAGEKSIYRCVISPSSSHEHDEKNVTDEYKLALLASYSHVVSIVVDRTMDAFETVFYKDAAVGKFDHPASEGSDELAPYQKVRATASVAAAGLRMLDGVRLLGPSLTKLCELSDAYSVTSDSKITLAIGLCICLHRTTVKNSAKAMENLAKAIQKDPLDGEKHRPKDARVAALSSDFVRVIRVISPFVAAYKSVSKRRALSWDKDIGEESGDIDTYAKHLVYRLLENLKQKSARYILDDVKHKDATHVVLHDAQRSIFMMNNTYYLLEQFGVHIFEKKKKVMKNNLFALLKNAKAMLEQYKIEESLWLRDTVEKEFERQKEEYLKQWEAVSKHLTFVDDSQLKYQKVGNLLTLESGRLLKSRFSGFIEDFELFYHTHTKLTVVDETLRTMLQIDISAVFLPLYKEFFEKYSPFPFSKKNQDLYLRYPPDRIQKLMRKLFCVENQ